MPRSRHSSSTHQGRHSYPWHVHQGGAGVETPKQRRGEVRCSLSAAAKPPRPGVFLGRQDFRPTVPVCVPCPPDLQGREGGGGLKATTLTPNIENTSWFCTLTYD